MKNKTNILGVSLVVLLIAVAVIAVIVFRGEPAVAYTPSYTDGEGSEIPGSVAVIETVNLGGVDQTLTIRGADTTKPVLLFLHGGARYALLAMGFPC